MVLKSFVTFKKKYINVSNDNFTIKETQILDLNAIKTDKLHVFLNFKLKNI